MITRRGISRGLGWVVVAAFLAGVPGASKPPRKGRTTATLPELNRKVLEFARGQMGKQVGDGECSTLPRDALLAAGAKVFPWAQSGDFVWGRPVASLADALPGDIVQFRDAVFDGKAVVSSDRWISWHYEYPHHTAIISAVNDGGAEVVLLHQNVYGAGPNKTPLKVVHQGTIRPGSLQPGGHLWVYRPMAPDDDPDAPATPPAEPAPSKPARPRR